MGFKSREGILRAVGSIWKYLCSACCRSAAKLAEIIAAWLDLLLEKSKVFNAIPTSSATILFPITDTAVTINFQQLIQTKKMVYRT